MISSYGLRTRVQPRVPGPRGLGRAYCGPGRLLRSSGSRAGILQSSPSRPRSMPTNRSYYARVVPGRGARRPIQRLSCIVRRQRTGRLWMRSEACSCLMSPAVGSATPSRRLLKWVQAVRHIRVISGCLGAPCLLRFPEAHRHRMTSRRGGGYVRPESVIPNAIPSCGLPAARE